MMMMMMMKCSAVAEMGDRLATIDVGRKLVGPDKSEVLAIGTSTPTCKLPRQQCVVRICPSVDVTVSEEMKVLGVVLDHRLSFVSHVTLTAL